MNKIRRLCGFLIVVLLIGPVAGAISQDHGQDYSKPGSGEKVFTIQIAASKVFIEPENFKQEFNITENVRYIKKDGWYKYYVGSYKTETEATKRLADLKLEAFVTVATFPFEDTLQRKTVPLPVSIDSTKRDSISSTDTSQLPKNEQYGFIVDDTEMRRRYNQKIREADSAFNLAKDLVLARGLYEEASLLAPDKNYPKDQVVEIDKQQIHNQTQSFLSKIPLRYFILAGIAAFLILAVVTLWIMKKKSNRQKGTETFPVEKDSEPQSEFLFGDTIKKRQILIEEIMQLYPVLADEISTTVKKPWLDHWHIHDQLERSLNSSNEVLRMEAEMALIRLDFHDPFSFLDTLHQEFTPWEQLHVIEMIKRNHIPLPDFSRWINSPNESVVLFCRRMKGDKEIRSQIRKPDMGLQGIVGEILETKIIDDLKAQADIKPEAGPGSQL